MTTTTDYDYVGITTKCTEEKVVLKNENGDEDSAVEAHIDVGSTFTLKLQ